MVAQDDLRQLVQSTRRISRALDIESRRIDREIGLTLPQLIVLQCLQDLGDANSHSISRAAGMSPPSVVGILDKLEAKGVIHRYRSTIDRRAVHTAPGPARGHFPRAGWTQFFTTFSSSSRNEGCSWKFSTRSVVTAFCFQLATKTHGASS